MKKVFLGGTCNNSKWRLTMMDLLDSYNIDYFNPVVPDWTPECQAKELVERQTCDYVLYMITPAMTGVYSIAEVTDDSNKRSEKTIFLFDDWEGMEFDPAQRKSLEAVKELVESNGAKTFDNI